MFLPLLLTLSAPAGIDLYLGTYTSNGGSRGIYHARLDPKTGGLSEPELVAEAENPSYLARRGRFLYAVHEVEKGTASAYRIGKEGRLSLVGSRGGLGSAPCHVSIDPKGKGLLVANYGAGTIASLPIGKDGGLDDATIYPNQGSGPDKGRQESSHLHAVHADARSRFAYACDLGTDEILVYRFHEGALEPLDRTRTRPGAGPRHFAFGKGGRFAYVNNELDNTVVAYAVDERGPLTAIQTLSTLPEGFKGASHSAAIVVHPSGRWLYVSNRGHDSLAVFAIGKDGTLAPVEVKDAGVKEPRGFEIDPSGRWLVVAGQNSDDLLSLPIDPETGRLGEAAGRAKLSKPVCVVFGG